jgi:hypothetical protein
MIENFDHLVERCNAKRRKRMTRISLWISGTILILVAITALAMQWAIDSKVPTVKKQVSHPVKIQSNVVPAAPKAVTIVPSESASVISPELTPITPESCIPLKDTSKTRAFVVQLTSSKSFDEVNASRRRIPEKYHSSLAIYYINEFYTLRYIDIYNHESLPQMVQYFHTIGFPSTTAYKYNPERIAITAPVNTISQALTPTKSIPAAKDIPVPIVPPTSQPQSVVAKSTVSSNRLFSVETSARNTTQDFISAYNANPRYEIGLKIAQNFYAQNNYLDAAIWAKKANQLNREGEEAWLLYAKSYYAQGRKIDAIGILELYLNYKDSKAASELVRTWKSTPAN